MTAVKVKKKKVTKKKVVKKSPKAEPMQSLAPETGLEKFIRVITHPSAMITIRLLMSFFFILASVGKVMDPERFAQTVTTYSILPTATIPPFAYTMPWLELIIGLMLLFNIFSRSAAVLATASLCMFIGAILIDLYRGIDIACGCFDFLFPEEEIGWKTIVRDFSMLGLTVYLMLFDKNEFHFWGIPKKLKALKDYVIEGMRGAA